MYDYNCTLAKNLRINLVNDRFLNLHIQLAEGISKHGWQYILLNVRTLSMQVIKAQSPVW